jgi:flagellar motor switch protein FliN/FliY
MTEAIPDLLHFLSDEFASALARILESMTDQAPTVTANPVSAPAPGEEFLWREQTLSIAGDPLMWAGAPAATRLELGGRTLRAAGVGQIETNDAGNTYIEILKQALSGVAQAIGIRLETEVTCAGNQEVPAPPADAAWSGVEVAYAGNRLPGILIGFSPQLLDRLQHPGAKESAEPAAESAAAALAGPGTAGAFVPQNSKTLDLLLDVELPVSVSFGRAELPLKDVLKLTTGSIVELNRGVTEPVEVIVNNCVVARGEVVVMDGNYGVRIHQIISPQERLRTLK